VGEPDVERNLETVRRYVVERPGEAWLEELPELFDPECDYYPAKAGPESEPRHGRDAIATYLRGWWSAWEDLRLEILDVTALDDFRVLAQVHMSAKGFSSGLALEGPIHMCFWMRHGRFIRVEDHMTLRGARHALGL
jgi:hypothetical protein